MLSCLPCPPPSASPLHCGSFWALGHHNGPSEGTDGGLFGGGHTCTKKKKKIRGRRVMVSERIGSRHAQLWTWESMRGGGGGSKNT